MSLHYLERDEVNGLKLLRRQQQAKWRKRAYVFINERPPALRPDGPAASPSSLVRSGERMVSDRPRRGHAACPRGRKGRFVSELAPGDLADPAIVKEQLGI
jgi:hypothetical protein